MTEKDTVISVIIPSYNHEKYIKTAIESVLNQSYSDLELIIIDDGSKDNSKEIINTYTDTRIRTIFQENRGAHAAINKGMQIAKGEFFTILNSDDFYSPKRLEKCLRIFDSKPEIDFISTWINIIDNNDKILGVKKAWQNMEPWPISDKTHTFAKSGDYTLNALMANFVATTSNMIFKRTVFEQLGGMRNLRFSHDWDFLLRVCHKFKPYNLEEPLVNYRIHGNNTISTYRPWMLFEICWIYATHIDLFADLLLPDIREETMMENIEPMLNSFNFQGNEHVVRLLYWQFTLLKSRGVTNPEELYLSNEKLRKKIIQHIVDDETTKT